MYRNKILVAESFQGSKTYSASEAQDILSEIFADPGLLLKELKASGLIKAAVGKIRRTSKK